MVTPNRSSRRAFLKAAATGSAVVSFSGVAPVAIQAAAEQSQSGRILVVIELAGGNDGLNSVIPYSYDGYRALRPTLAIPESSILKVADGIGFHPALRSFADLLEAGKLAVVQGVGYPDPNRSHFESMDIWHTCQRKDEVRTDGWLGRLAEKTELSAAGDPVAIHLGFDKQPFALMSRNVRIPSIRSLDQFRLEGIDHQEFRNVVRALADGRRPDGNDLLSFVQASTSSAIDASERLASSTKIRSSEVVYPQSGLGDQLQTVAKLIRSELKTSVYYLQLFGFDTHSQQPDVHQNLLRQLGDSVKAFLDDLESMKQSDRVTVMAFSEFGRRVEENASEGTDHGTAGPIFVAGAAVKPGLIGSHPSLEELQDGDLIHHTDFRQVYAAFIQEWFQCKADTVLKCEFRPVELFRAEI